MTRITNADQVLLLLRGHLQRAQRQRKKDGPGAPERKQIRQGPLDRVQQLAGAEKLTDAGISRALIAGLLAEEFGAAVANDPSFQQMIDDVRQIIDNDESGRELLKNAVSQLAARGGK